jgi:hypothetical protein
LDPVILSPRKRKLASVDHFQESNSRRPPENQTLIEFKLELKEFHHNSKPPLLTKSETGMIGLIRDSENVRHLAQRLFSG